MTVSDQIAAKTGIPKTSLHRYLGSGSSSDSVNTGDALAPSQAKDCPNGP